MNENLFLPLNFSDNYKIVIIVAFVSYVLHQIIIIHSIYRVFALITYLSLKFSDNKYSFLIYFDLHVKNK